MFIALVVSLVISVIALLLSVGCFISDEDGFDYEDPDPDRNYGAPW